MIRLVITLAMCFAFSGVARADQIAFLPGSPAVGSAELTRRAERGIHDALAREGLEWIERADVARRLPPHLRSCGRTACGADVASALDVTFVVGVAVWTERDATPTIAISLIARDGAAYGSSAEIVANGVEGAALVALADARRKQRRGRGPFLAVRGAPAGALVLVDGTEVGVLPHFAAIAPGRHRVEVRLDGYRTESQTVDVGLDEEREHEIDVALHPGEVVAVAPHPQARYEPRASGWNYVIGGGLAVIGVAAAVGPITTALREGDVIETRGSTIAVARFGEQSVFLAGLSLASLVGAGIFVLGTPLEVQVEVGQTDAALRVEGAF